MISVIIPVFNRIESFEKTLLSIFNQTYKDVEVIIVDDGSDINIKKENSIDCIGKKINGLGRKTQGLPLLEIGD